MFYRQKKRSLEWGRSCWKVTQYVLPFLILAFLTPNSRSVFCAGVSLNIHSFIHSFIHLFIHSWFWSEMRCSSWCNGLSISCSSQCSTTGVTKAVVCIILSVGWFTAFPDSGVRWDVAHGAMGCLFLVPASFLYQSVL